MDHPGLADDQEVYMVTLEGDDPLEPGQSYEIDLFRPEDAKGVCDLFLSVYGRDYPIKTYLEPQRLTEENAAGRTISTVARTPKGDIVGHNALFNSAPYEGIYESGAGVVHRDYRGGKGIFSRMVAHGQEVGARRFGVESIYGESVCNHVFSQRMTHRLGWITHAVEVDLMPASAYSKEKSASGRVASLLDSMTLKPRPHAVYVPAVYEDALRFIYSGLDDGRDLVVSHGRPAESRTRVHGQYFGFAQVTRLAVWQMGSDFFPVMDEEEARAREQGAMVIQVWLNLSQPWVGQGAEILRERGYFLGGVLPRWFDADGLLMQRILGRPHWEGIQVQFDRGKEILELVKGDWSRTADIPHESSRDSR